MKLNTKETIACAAVGKAFRSLGKDLHKIAPQIRAAIGKATGEKLNLLTTAIYDTIRTDCRNEKGSLMSWAKIKGEYPEVRAAYDAARQAISRYVRSRDNKGPAPRLGAAQKAYNAAFDAKASLQKMENCPMDLIAAFDAVMAKAITLGATAKVAK